MKHPDYDKAFRKTPDYIRSAIELGLLKGERRMRARRRLAGALTAAAVLVVLLGVGAFGVSRLAANRPDDRVGGLRGPNVLSAGGRGGQPEPNPVPENTAAQEDTATPPPAASEPQAQDATATPEATAAPARSEASAANGARTAEPTPAPRSFDSAAEGGDGAAEAAISPAKEAATEPTPTPGIESTPAPLICDSPTAAPARFESSGREAGSASEPASTALDPLAREALAAATQEPTPGASTPAPTAFDSALEEDEGAAEAAFPLVEEVNPESTPTLEAPTPGIDPTPTTLNPLAREALAVATPEPTPEAPTPGIESTPTADDPLAREALAAATSEPSPSAAPAPGVDPTSVPGALPVYLSAFVDEGADPFFHLDRSCGGREPLPVEMDITTALWVRFTPCPDCVEGRGYRLLAFRADGTGDVAIRDGLWYTPSGNYFHVDSNCSGMAGAQEHGIAEAFASGKRSCPVCMENWTCAAALDAPEAEAALASALGDAQTVHLSDGTSIAIAPATEEHVSSEAAPTEDAQAEYLPDGASIAVEPAPATEVYEATEVAPAGDAQAEYLSDGASIAVEPAPATEVYEAAEVAPATEAALDAVYYAEDGSYFHGKADCSVLRAEEGSGANGVVVIGGSLMDALRAGKDACPLCLSGWDFVVSAVPTGEEVVEYGAVEGAASEAREGWAYEAIPAVSIEEEITFVFAADGEGGFFHLRDSCGGEMLNRKLSVEQALTEGLTPCPVCLPEDACPLIAYYEADGSGVSTEALWYTDGGKYFHSSMYCDGMWGAAIHPIAEAFASGKSACPKCMDGWTFALLRIENAETESAQAQIEMAQPTPAPEEAPADLQTSAPPVEFAVSGAEGAQDEIAVSPSAAPYDISHRFYYTPNGQYYHMASDCSGMTGAKRHSAAETAASGKRHCPVCIGDNLSYYWLPAPREDGDYDTPNLYFAEKDAWIPSVWSDAGNVFVPLNPEGGQPNYYHINPECFGMNGAKMIPWEEARASGLGPCPACLPVWNSGGSRTICYASDGDSLYHADPNCSGIRWARELTQLAAQTEGRLRCPLCAAETAPAAWTELRPELGVSIADAYPGWIFERADEFEDRTEWFISNGEEAIRAAIFRFAEDSEASILELTLEHGDTATRFFPQSFIESLPAPLDVIQDVFNPESIFTLRLEYDANHPTAFTAGETTGKETKYTNWTILPNGTAATIPKN